MHYDFLFWYLYLFLEALQDKFTIFRAHNNEEESKQILQNIHPKEPENKSWEELSQDDTFSKEIEEEAR